MQTKRLAAAFAAFVISFAAHAQPTSSIRAGDIAVETDVAIHYEEAGDPGAAVTILFVPGWSMTTAVWRDQMAAFAPAARVVAVDPRSQGRSTLTMRSNTPERRAQDLRQVIRALSLRNVLLVGWSQGVQDVASYASAFGGEGLAGYVLVDSAVSAGPAASVAQPEQLRQQLERMAIYGRYQKEYLKGMMNAIIQSPHGRARIDEFVELGMRTPPDIGISMLMNDFVLTDRRPTLAKFDRPTLVVASAQSGELEAQRQMAAQIGNAQIEVVDQAGHAVFIDQPERFRQLLAAFMQRVKAASPG
jgi:microsomal epoxide hydrolase